MSEVDKRKNVMDDYGCVGRDSLHGQFLRRFWIPVLAAEELAAGRARPVTVLGEKYTFFRGEDSTPAVIGFRCAHRGCQLSTGFIEGSALRCRYHGWKYSATGQCLDVPGEGAQFASRISVPSRPVQDYLDLIWVYLGDGEAPTLPRYPMFEPDSELELREIYQYEWPMNFTNSLENDPFHVSWTHRDTWVDQLGRRGSPTIECEETEYGYLNRTIAPPGEPNWPDGAEGHFIMPFGQLGARPLPLYGRKVLRQALAFRIPIDDANMKSIGWNMTYFPDVETKERYLTESSDREHRLQALGLESVNSLGERILRGEATEDGQHGLELDLHRRFRLQDYLAQVGQGTMAPRGTEEHLSRNVDATVITLRRIMRREMTAIANGEPLTQWKLPEALYSLAALRELKEHSPTRVRE